LEIDVPNEPQPLFRVAIEGLFPPVRLPQLLPADYVANLTKPIVDSIAIDISSHLPDFRQTILDSLEMPMPDWSGLLPNISEVVGANFSGELARAFAPSIQDLQRSILDAMSPATGPSGFAAAIAAARPSGALTAGLPSADELLSLGTAVTTSHASDPVFLETARETVNGLSGAEPAIEKYIASLSGYATNALELIRQGIYAFVFTAWILLILGLSSAMPEIDGLIGATGLAAPVVATKAQRRWDDFIDKV
jgi:hypothetical protein